MKRNPEKKRIGYRVENRIAGALRIFLTALLVLLQFFIVGTVAFWATRYAAIVYFALSLMGIVCVVGIINREGMSTFRLMWVVIILVLPVAGVIMYLLWGGGSPHQKESAAWFRRLRGKRRAAGSAHTIRRLGEGYPQWKRAAQYLDNHGFSLYRNTASEYLPTGEAYFERLIADLEAAQHFIFLEYFIVGEGRLFGRIAAILRRKVTEGVEVRILYDDFGSILRMSNQMAAELQDAGIRLAAFNPVHRYVNRLYLNFRNHEKLTVVDGRVAYAGGVNIGDEYANLIRRFGYWKDAGIRLEGEGVAGLCEIFLRMWSFTTQEDQRGWDRYLPVFPRQAEGFCQPFCDGPMNNPDDPAETLYIEIISTARRYVYITSPYLAVDDVMMRALCIAGESGVDVRLMLPAIPDHWYTQVVANSYYGQLLGRGVRIFEYTPGFLHAKCVVCDDETAVVGSVNMDFRSFHMHYECGVFLCGTGAVPQIRDDLRGVCAASREVTLEEWNRRPLPVKALQRLLRLIAPLM